MLVCKQLLNREVMRSIGCFLLVSSLHNRMAFVSPLRLIQTVWLDEINVCGCLPYVNTKQGIFDNDLITITCELSESQCLFVDNSKGLK